MSLEIEGFVEEPNGEMRIVFPSLGNTWHQLIQLGYRCAAAGLLEDAFFKLWVLEDCEDDPVSSPDEEETQRDLIVQRASLRESVLDILGDEDGSKLRRWQKQYDNNRAAFCKRAKRLAQAPD